MYAFGAQVSTGDFLESMWMIIANKIEFKSITEREEERDQEGCDEQRREEIMLNLVPQKNGT